MDIDALVNYYRDSRIRILTKYEWMELQKIRRRQLGNVNSSFAENYISFRRKFSSPRLSLAMNASSTPSNYVGNNRNTGFDITNVINKTLDRTNNENKDNDSGTNLMPQCSTSLSITCNNKKNDINDDSGLMPQCSKTLALTQRSNTNNISLRTITHDNEKGDEQNISLPSINHYYLRSKVVEEKISSIHPEHDINEPDISQKTISDNVQPKYNNSTKKEYQCALVAECFNPAENSEQCTCARCHKVERMHVICTTRKKVNGLNGREKYVVKLKPTCSKNIKSSSSTSSENVVPAITLPLFTSCTIDSCLSPIEMQNQQHNEGCINQTNNRVERKDNIEEESDGREGIVLKAHRQKRKRSESRFEAGLKKVNEMRSSSPLPSCDSSDNGSDNERISKLEAKVDKMYRAMNYLIHGLTKATKVLNKD